MFIKPKNTAVDLEIGRLGQTAILKDPLRGKRHSQREYHANAVQEYHDLFLQDMHTR
jgi:hypothetical protein